MISFDYFMSTISLMANHFLLMVIICTLSVGYILLSLFSDSGDSDDDN